MRSLLLHCNSFECEITTASTRPLDIKPEPEKLPVRSLQNCLSVLFCVEKGDNEVQVNRLYQEIMNNAAQMGIQKIMLVPFVHLSKNIADSNDARKYYFLLLQTLKDTPLQVEYSHFGYHKTTRMDIKGHKLAYRYREF